MPKCPKCGKKINFLKNYESGVVLEYNFSIDSEGEPYYEFVDEIACDSNVFSCPKCGADLFTSEEEAIKFLRGKR